MLQSEPRRGLRLLRGQGRGDEDTVDIRAQVAELHEGERVLDLGSRGGIDTEELRGFVLEGPACRLGIIGAPLDTL